MKDIVGEISKFLWKPKWKKTSPLLRQILVALGPLVSTITLGMTSGYSAVLLPQLKNSNSSVVVTVEEESWIASMAALPMAFGCLLGGFLMEKFGRKTTQLLTTIPSFFGWTLIALGGLPAILAGRFLTGISGGLLGPSTGVYISETSDPKYRGFLLGAISLAMALGLFFVHFLGTFLHWKTTAVISGVFPVLSLFFLVLVPESPSWLAKKGKVTKAQESFFWCRGDGDAAKKEMSEIINKQNVKSEKILFKPLVIIVVFIVTNQWAGVNALTFYTVSIMQKTLTNGLNNYLAMLVVDVIRVAMSILACILMKNLKRRPLAIISGVGTFTSLFILSGYSFFTKSYPNLDSWYTTIPMTALVAYISFITVGFVPLPWAMMGEIFPLSSRNVGSGISSFMAFLAFFSVVKTSPEMFDKLGVDGTFMVYGTVAFCGTIFIAAFLPETKDKTLKEIENQLEK